ncbi:MAG: tetratricopeptide repeat protein [Actinomycetota bacterium]
MSVGKGWKRVGFLAVALLILAMALQTGLDRTPTGSGERAGNFPSAASLARFMGGIREYFAYTFFIKTDKLYHVYDNDAELIPYFRIITYLDPHYVDAYYILPGLLHDVGRKEEAIELCREGIRANPESGDLYFGLGDLMLKEGRYTEALEAFEQAHALKLRITGRYMVTRGLEVLYKKLGREEDARRITSEAIITNRVRLVDEDLEVEDLVQLVSRINRDCDLIVPGGLE